MAGARDPKRSNGDIIPRRDQDAEKSGAEVGVVSAPALGERYDATKGAGAPDERLADRDVAGIDRRRRSV